MARPGIILFDVNETLLDLRPMKDRIGKLLGTSPDAPRLWFTTTLHYSLVMTAADRYADFAAIGAACLRMLARNQGIELSEDAAREAVAPMRSLPPHPDAPAALARLRDAGYRLATLTNSSTAAVADQMKHAGLTSFFEVLLSVEEVGMYKPHTHVYRWAAGRVGVDVSECLLVAAHGWDMAGASLAGMMTAFVARPGQQLFPLVPAPTFTIASLAELPEQLERL